MLTKQQKIEKIIEFTINHFEGGYVNNPNDKGGPTKFGITQKVYDGFFKVKSSIDDIKNMKIEDAIRIYKFLYFDNNDIDVRFPEQLWHFVFDCYVQHGIKPTVKIIQRGLNQCGEDLKVDGIIGNQTISKISCHSPEKLLQYMIDWRIWLYNEIVEKNPSQKVFLNGWLKRVNWFKENKLF